jgi:hypothetical protein
MNAHPDPHSHDAGGASAEADSGLVDRARRVGGGLAMAKSARKRHISIAVPFRGVERSRSVAWSVLAGGVASRLFLWLLP